MNAIRPIDKYVIDSLLKENKITSDALLTIIQELTAPTDFCNKLITLINSPKGERAQFIKLLNWGKSKLDCVKVLKQYFGMSLLEAKNTVDTIPVILSLDNLNETQIEYVTKQELPKIQVAFALIKNKENTQ